MKIIIDATFNPHGGSLIHLQEFIVNLKKLVSPNKLYIFTKKDNMELIGVDVLADCAVKVVVLPSINRFFWILWVQLILPFKAMFLGCDVLFSPGNISPIIKTANIKAQWVATIGPFDEKVYLGLTFKERMILHLNKAFMLFSMKSSNIVIHESRYSLDLFLDKYKLNKNYQYLIECGRSDFFYNCLDKEVVENESVSEIQPNDLLCVSHFYPYKNLETLIYGYNAFMEKNANKNVKLVICGLPTFDNYYQKIVLLAKQSKYKENIIFTGGVNRADLRYAYSRCKFMIFPSLAESSGYTLIEAMSCGTAIITTKLTAIPYTCGDAALYFDALDGDDLRKKILTLNNDSSLLNNLRNRAVERKNYIFNYSQAAALFYKYIISRKSKR